MWRAICGRLWRGPHKRSKAIARKTPLNQKEVAVESPKIQLAPKAVSLKVVFSATISEILAINLTIAPGTNQFVYAKSDFTCVETLYVSFYGAST